MYDSSLIKNRKYNPLGNLADSSLVCASSTRLHQNMSLFYGDTRNSLSNRMDFLDALGIDHRNLVCAQQIHGSDVSYVKEEDKGRGALSYDSSIANTDALVTDERNLPLAIFTADCVSIFLYDAISPAIGLIHAGWRSTREDITAKTIQLMQEKFNTKTSSLYAGFGPAIRSCCYEVSRDFENSFPNEITERDNRYYIDLVRINKKRLLDLGVDENNIFDSRICTSCNAKEFFSYRREGKACGRMISVIVLK